MERYVRQARFAPLGQAGQARLATASVAILGLGATGSAIFQALVRAGIGQIRIADRDWVEIHNLPRQSVYTEADAEAQMPKAVAAARYAKTVNQTCHVETFVCDINATTIEQVVDQADVILDGSDNLELRYLMNEWCVRSATPWVYTGILGAHGMTATMIPEQACFRCLFPDVSQPGALPTCETAGVLGSMVGVLAGLAATEAIKILVGAKSLNPGLLIIDGWHWSFDQLPKPACRADCPVCGQAQFPLLAADGPSTVQLCGRDVVQVRPPLPARLDLSQLAQRLETAGYQVRSNDYLLRVAVEQYQLTVFPDGRAMIHGTDNLALARSVYARWIGI